MSHAEPEAAPYHFAVVVAVVVLVAAAQKSWCAAAHGALDVLAAAVADAPVAAFREQLLAALGVRLSVAKYNCG
jgi:hypothetical protein